MTLKIVVRSYGGENRKNRPAFYSKLVALQSLLRAVQGLADADRAGPEVVFLNDGPVPDDRLRLMEAAGEVVTLPRVGMRRSYVAALRLAITRGWSDDDLVWFSEDDYLYTPEALSGLVDAAETLDADYFALYGGTADLPVEDGKVLFPRGWHQGEAAVVNGRRWLRGVSTTSTFAARRGALRTDFSIFLQALLPHRTMLRDHDTCVVFQGYEPHRWADLAHDLVGRADGTPRQRLREAALVPFKAALNLRSHRRPANRRVLMTASPNLATHLETAMIAPGTDWARVARETAAWAAGEAADTTPGRS